MSADRMHDSVKEYAKRTAKPIRIKHRDVGSGGSVADSFLNYEVRMELREKYDSFMRQL